MSLSHSLAHWRTLNDVFFFFFFFFTVTTTPRTYFRKRKVGHATSGNSTAIQLPVTALYLRNGSRYRLETKSVLQGRVCSSIWVNSSRSRWCLPCFNKFICGIDFCWSLEQGTKIMTFQTKLYLAQKNFHWYILIVQRKNKQRKMEKCNFLI